MKGILAGVFIAGAAFACAVMVGCQPTPERLHSLTGAATLAGIGLPGVTVSLSAGAAAVTDSSGHFAFTGFADGTYTLTPAREGYSFTPTTRSVTLQGGDATVDDFVATALLPPLPDVFVYYLGSVFQFLITDEGSGAIPKRARMTWRVTGYDPSSSIATITSTLDPATTTTPLPATFFLRRASDGALEYSPSGIVWTPLTGWSAAQIDFVFGEHLLPVHPGGDVAETVVEATVPFPEGSGVGLVIRSEYVPPPEVGNQYVAFTESSYSPQIGLAYFETGTWDQTLGYLSYSQRSIELAAFRIVEPGGGVREGGVRFPEPPSDLAVTYTFQETFYDAGAHMMVTGSYMTFTWRDNSDNEVAFVPHWKGVDGAWHPPEYFTDTTYWPLTWSSGSQSGMLMRISWGDWPSGTYSFKVGALNGTGEMALSDEFLLTVP